MLQIVFDKTNKTIIELREKYSISATFVDHLNIVEFEAFIGLLIFF